MVYLILFCSICLIFYLLKNKQSKNKNYLNVQFEKGTVDYKKIKLDSLNKLKNSFKYENDINYILKQAEFTLEKFHFNHGYNLNEIKEAAGVESLPIDLFQREDIIKKKINRFYKLRNETKSKLISIHLSYEHIKLQLQNLSINWNNFLGLKKIQTNWKDEEYFNELLLIMKAYQKNIKNSEINENILSEIEKIFNLWNSQIQSRLHYENLIQSYSEQLTSINKHFSILGILGYLSRKNVYNPSVKPDLIKWCLKDVELYEDFLKSFHENELLTMEEKISFHDKEDEKEERLKKISFEKVKKLKNYLVPRLESFDILNEIYISEKKYEELKWLQSIGYKIGYIQNINKDTDDQDVEFDLKKITKEIEVKKTTQKGKKLFLDSKNNICSTEEAFKDYYELKGWKVMRAEVSFWQGMFCLAFWEQIFFGMDITSKKNDIPIDLFENENFYNNRKAQIDEQYERLRKGNLKVILNNKIEFSSQTWTRLLFNGEHNLVSDFKTDLVQEFFAKIDPIIFSKIVYRIAKNPSQNRSGISDFVIWNAIDLKMIEVKKSSEKVSETQVNWLTWMDKENIPVEIVRVKGI